MSVEAVQPRRKNGNESSLGPSPANNNTSENIISFSPLLHVNAHAKDLLWHTDQKKNVEPDKIAPLDLFATKTV